MDSKKRSSRRYDFDWLRVAATLVVFLFHSTRFFNQRDYVVNNAVTYEWVNIWCIFAMSWLMPLFFIISGVSLFYGIGKYDNRRQFVADKFLRLMIPVMVGSVTHCALQVYLERVSHGLFSGSIIAFIPHYFDGIYSGIGQQNGNFSFVGMHLWYLLFFFIYCLIFYRLFVWLKGSGEILLERISSLFTMPGLIYIWLSIPLMVMYIVIPPAALTIGAGDWGFFYYPWFLTAGFIIASSPRLQQFIQAQRRRSLFLGLLLSTVYFYLPLSPPNMLYPAAGGHWAATAVSFLNTWCWLLAILGFGMQRLNVNHPFLRYANEGVLPFYIVHQSILVIIGYFIVTLEINDIFKWMFIAGSSFILIIALHAFLIRRFDPLRFLFGLKTKHPFFHLFQKRGALLAMTAAYVGLIIFAATGISIDRTPMPLSYDAERDIILNFKSITRRSSTGVNLVADKEASVGKAIEFSSGANQPAKTKPRVYAEMEFSAPAGRYFVWLRGKSEMNHQADSAWLQLDDDIGTPTGNFQVGDWCNLHPSGLYAWAGDGDRPIAIELSHNGTHKIRIQPRQTPHRIDQIWLSRSQKRIPDVPRYIR